MAYASYAVAGSQLQLSVSGTPTLIKGVQSVTGPGGDKPQIDVTAISDTARVLLGGTPSFGDVKFAIAYDPNESTHTALFTSYTTNNSTDTLTIAYPTAAGTHKITMPGSVTTFSWNFAKDAAILVDAGFRLSGSPTVT